MDIVRIDETNDRLLDRIEDDVFDARPSPEHLRRFHACRDCHLIVAVERDRIVGQLVARVHPRPDKAPELFIDNLGVTARLRRRGVATRLLDEAVRVGRDRDCVEAWVAADPGNAAARSFYEASGFVGERALVYVKALCRRPRPSA